MKTTCELGEVLRKLNIVGVRCGAGAVLLMSAALAYAQTASPSVQAEPSAAAQAPRARIGIVMAENNSARGVLVTQTNPNGPADRVGLQPGDLILAVDGKNVTNPAELQAIVFEHRPGDTLQLSVMRAGWQRNFSLLAVDQAGLSKVPASRPIAAPAPPVTRTIVRSSQPYAREQDADAWEKIRDPYLRARYTYFK